MSQKKEAPYSSSCLHQILTDFKNSLLSLSRKFTTKPSFKIQPRLKHIATLPVSESWCTLHCMHCILTVSALHILHQNYGNNVQTLYRLRHLCSTATNCIHCKNVRCMCFSTLETDMKFNSNKSIVMGEGLRFNPLMSEVF